MTTPVTPPNTIGGGQHNAMTPLAHEFSTVATLIDGAVVTLRTLRAEDYDAVIVLAADFSAEDRYLRFFTPRPAYIGEEILSRPVDGVISGELQPAASGPAFGAWGLQHFQGVSHRSRSSPL